MELPMDAYNRRIDELGRVVLPLELRRTLDLEPGNTVRFSIVDGKLVIEKV